MRPSLAVAAAVAVSILSALPAAPPAAEDGRIAYEKSVIALNVTFQTWDEDRPWAKRKPEYRRVNGVVVGPGLVLTTAQLLEQATAIQVEISGRVRRGQATIDRVDPTSNLALLRLAEEDAAGLVPAPLAAQTPTAATLMTARWRGSQFEVAASRIIRVEVERTFLGHTNHAHLRMRTDMSGGGWAEPVFALDSLVGITVSQSADESRAIPAEIIAAFMAESAPQGRHRGLTTLGVNWQLSEDNELSAYLGQQGDPRGVLIRETIWGATACGALLPRDILIELAGEPVDSKGTYRHPRLGRLSFDHLMAERFREGEALTARVLRNGLEQEIRMTARAYPHELDLVPSYRSGAPPYTIVGGLVLRELDQPYLRTWGKDWSKDAPDRLLSRFAFESDRQRADRRRFVIISSVLPSAYNLGYHDIRDVGVDRINGRRIAALEDVGLALASPDRGFHVIDLTADAPSDQIVLDAAGLEAATAAILKDYGIPGRSRPRETPLPEGGDGCGSPAAGS